MGSISARRRSSRPQPVATPRCGLALAAPERVSRLALLGPMGITPLGVRRAMLRMMIASLVPTDTCRAAYEWMGPRGTTQAVVEGYGGMVRDSPALGRRPHPRVGRPVALSRQLR